MKKTRKVIFTLVSTMLAGNLSGCAEEQILYEPPGNPPYVEGIDNSYWVWDEEDGEWEYCPPGQEEAELFYYNGKLFKKSIKYSGLTSNAKIKSSFTSTKSSFSGSKMSGFGSGFKGGGFGG